MSFGVVIVFGVVIPALVVLVVAVSRPRRPVARGPVTADLLAGMGALIAEGRKIHAIKALRERTGMGLRDARDYVEALAVTGEPPPPPRHDVSPETLDRARGLLAAGRVVQAVKVVREETGWDLRRCKDVVDRLR